MRSLSILFRILLRGYRARPSNIRDKTKRLPFSEADHFHDHLFVHPLSYLVPHGCIVGGSLPTPPLGPP